MAPDSEALAEALAEVRRKNNEHLSTCGNCQAKVAAVRHNIEVDPLGHVKAVRRGISSAFVVGLFLGIMMTMSVLWAAWR